MIKGATKILRKHMAHFGLIMHIAWPWRKKLKTEAVFSLPPGTEATPK
jgi:hypothetical protein